MSLFASLNLFRTALTAVLRSPVSFFDTTPMGMTSLLYVLYSPELRNLYRTYPFKIVQRSRLSRQRTLHDLDAIPQYIFFYPWNRRFSLLHLPISRDSLCTYGGWILFRRCFLP